MIDAPTRARPRICELPDRKGSNRARRTFTRIYNAENGATTWTVVFCTAKGAPLYRWTRMEPGAPRHEAAAAIRKMRSFLAGKLRSGTLH
jgi:hypothetical protein